MFNKFFKIFYLMGAITLLILGIGALLDGNPSSAGWGWFALGYVVFLAWQFKNMSADDLK
ncbi:hypothetical protein AVL55_10590 [Alteromonas macleodii]|jgi:hypothetical protein|uniref:Uncharacterized protein n=1 Tax=Alteromonas macleodii TaxID=28108 RepID=A0A126Q0L6_ALTMA|nr:hypothetical protein AVL55_10590 [Alteromonas macleodii]